MKQELKMDVEHLWMPHRLDVYLSTRLKENFSRQEIKAAIDEGEIKVNGKEVKPSFKVTTGDKISGVLTSEKQTQVTGENIPIKIIYEDEDILVVDKPAGMVVHPGAGHKSGTLVNALLGRGQDLSNVSGNERPGIVHRLDKDTSGILLVAKNNKVHRTLQEQFQQRQLSKTYLVLVKGIVDRDQGLIELSMGRDRKNKLKMSVSTAEDARDAQTRYKVIDRFRTSTYLEVRILSGRTHQIRVHMTNMGHPVIGDELYHRRQPGERMMLHASRIEFEHPESGKHMSFESPLPKEFIDCLEVYKKIK